MFLKPFDFNLVNVECEKHEEQLLYSNCVFVFRQLGDSNNKSVFQNEKFVNF
jgi:hypothetical protein